MAKTHRAEIILDLAWSNCIESCELVDREECMNSDYPPNCGIDHSQIQKLTRHLSYTLVPKDNFLKLAYIVSQ